MQVKGDPFEDSALQKKTIQPNSDPKSKESLKRKDMTKLKFVNKEKIFLKNNNLKNIMVKKLNNDGFLKALARNVIFKQSTVNKEHTATISNKPHKKQTSQPRISKEENSKRLSNLNINNLNININFNSISSKNLTKGRSIEPPTQNVKQTIPARKDAILAFKNGIDNVIDQRSSIQENIPLNRIESPTYSLLNKFKNEAKYKDLNVLGSNFQDKKVDRLAQNSKNRQILTETISKLQFRKKGSAEKIFDTPSQNLNSLNIHFKNAIKDKLKNYNIEQKVNSHSRHPDRTRDGKFVSQDAYFDESYNNKIVNRVEKGSAKVDSKNIRMISNLKSKKKLAP
jgi:hypothetical protein